MRRLFPVLPFLLFAIGFGAADAPAQIDAVYAEPDSIVRIQAVRGEESFVYFELDDPAYLSVTPFFPPDAALPIKIQVRREAGVPVPLDDYAVEKPGTYTVSLMPLGHYEGPIDLKIDTAPPLDEFEPNDGRADAARIELPFKGTVWLYSDEDVDWFRFFAPRNTVIGVHLFAGGLDGPGFAIRDTDGNILYRTTETLLGPAGMRFIAGTGEPLYLEVWNRAPLEKGDPRAFMRLHVIAYPAVREDAGGTPGLVALGPDRGEAPGTDEPAQSVTGQLGLIGAATGHKVIEAAEAEDVSTVLEEAIAADLDWLYWLLGALAALAAILAILYWLDRRGGGAATPPETDAAKPETPAGR